MQVSYPPLIPLIERLEFFKAKVLNHTRVGSWPKTAHRTDMCESRGEPEGVSRQAFGSLERLICI